MDPERRQWLERLARACRHVLTGDGDRADPHYAALLDDVADLLARIDAELAAAED